MSESRRHPLLAAKPPDIALKEREPPKTLSGATKKAKTERAAGSKTSNDWGESEPSTCDPVTYDGNTGSFVRTRCEKRPLQLATSNPATSRLEALRRRGQEKLSTKQLCEQASAS